MAAEEISTSTERTSTTMQQILAFAKVVNELVEQVPHSDCKSIGIS